eukprot:5965879-Prymnesium_polylepis.1
MDAAHQPLELLSQRGRLARVLDHKLAEVGRHARAVDAARPLPHQLQLQHGRLQLVELAALACEPLVRRGRLVLGARELRARARGGERGSVGVTFGQGAWWRGEAFARVDDAWMDATQ